jgi:hypothetical protein
MIPLAPSSAYLFPDAEFEGRPFGFRQHAKLAISIRPLFER